MQSRANHDSMRRPIHPPRQERGAVAVVIALSLVGLIGFMGLALDLGKLFVAKSELQNSADACALAAARELTGANTNQLVLANAAGEKTAEQHKVLFQGEQIVVKSVQFSDVLTGSYQDAFTGVGATDLRFARCEVERKDIANWFIQVLNIGDRDVSASAVATLVPSQVDDDNGACPIPVGICENKLGPSVPVGTWLTGAVNAGKNTGGFFGFVDPTSNGSCGSSASCLEEQLLTDQKNLCGRPPNNTDIRAKGNMQNMAKAWNSRFGIYKGNVKPPSASNQSGYPDYSGYAYTDQATWEGDGFAKAYNDFIAKRAVNEPYQEAAEGGETIEGKTFLAEWGRDRRVVIAPVIDCNTGYVERYACVFMLHPLERGNGNACDEADRMCLEYLGSSDEDTPCATSTGIPAGGPSSTAAGALVPALVR